MTTADQFPPQGDLYRAPSLASEGFIHFSYAHQWRLTQQRYYCGQDNLVLLTIDPARLSSPLREENGFPHLYGPMEVEAVLEVRPLPTYRDLPVTLLSAVYAAHGGEVEDDLRAAQEAGARLVVLPELPLNPWSPARQEACAQDLEGGRAAILAGAANAVGVALLGGVIESVGEQRRNVAYLWGPSGRSCLRYEKLHLPSEPGFWEAHHYSPGTELPGVSYDLGFPLGIQICSDSNRPFGAMALRRQGAGAILIPRATERGTYSRWLRIFQALAQMTACYILSVNRPAPELGVPLGGPSVVVGPDGEVLAESEERFLSWTLEQQKVVQARESYPGYLEVPAGVYARGWSALTAG